jgi:predicted anti-sigma-YlaC factor YlaD
MRCSYFEPLLDPFIDGELTSIERARVIAHVDTCDHCRGLLEELRVVDALLIVPRQLEPAPNFTFRAMAEIRPLPVPHVHRTPALGVVAAYLVFAWLVIGAWFVVGGDTARATLGFFASLGARYGRDIAALGPETARLFGHATPNVGVAMGAILAFDALLAVGFAIVYAVVRPRMLARATQPSEGAP